MYDLKFRVHSGLCFHFVQCQNIICDYNFWTQGNSFFNLLKKQKKKVSCNLLPYNLVDYLGGDHAVEQRDSEQSQNRCSCRYSHLCPHLMRVGRNLLELV